MYSHFKTFLQDEKFGNEVGLNLSGTTVHPHVLNTNCRVSQLDVLMFLIIVL